MTLPPLAAAGFGTDANAERYERARPTYPPEVVTALAHALGIGPGRRVLDLAAGTGKLTRLLAATGADVVAVEPLAAMRQAFAVAVAGVEVLDGTAEAIPLPDASVDAVTVAQAFHWFDPPRALAEMARVLRLGGGLALVWNERDESVPWVAERSRVMHWTAQMPYDEDTDWSALVAAHGGFTALRTTPFAFGQALDADLLCERVASSSYIAAMPDAQRATLVHEVRALVADFPSPFVLPYVCTVHWCHLSSSSPS